MSTLVSGRLITLQTEILIVSYSIFESTCALGSRDTVLMGRVRREECIGMRSALMDCMLSVCLRIFLYSLPVIIDQR